MKNLHVFIFGVLFLIFISFTIYKMADGVTLNPGNIAIHTSLVYYDNNFSSQYTVLDTNSALFFLNQSNEKVYATIFEYDKNYREVKYLLTIGPGQNQYIKTDGVGIVYFQNEAQTSISIARFSKWTFPKKYDVPKDFSF